jgi:circadian clock protein KaiC
VPPEATLDPEKELTLFHPAELELTETSKLIFDRVNELKPSRIVFDSCRKCACWRKTRYAIGGRF